MSAIDPRRSKRQRLLRWDPKLDLMRQARHLSGAALEVIHEVMLDIKAKPSERVAAASIILDRGWGRAPQSVHLDVTQRPTELSHLSTAELQALAAGRSLPRLVTIDGEAVNESAPE